jgi:hypothetical protein
VTIGPETSPEEAEELERKQPQVERPPK